MRCNPVATTVLDAGDRLGLPSWYLGAGAIAQTVWNCQHGFEPTHGIADYDVVYFDPEDLTADGERDVAERAMRLIGDVGAELDVTNEARVHLWYPERFGRSIPPYRSTEDAIGTWPTTATSVGVRTDGDEFVVCAPFGLSDLFAMVVRPNKTIITQSVYEAKAQRWTELWPQLTVLPW